jgi:DNA-3-methyladenine glycosylase I
MLANHQDGVSETATNDMKGGNETMTSTTPHRCGWATTEALAKYHDEEWGVPSRDDRHLFEMLILEGAQAGLSWSTILNKRDGYQKLFRRFDIDRVAAFTEDDVERLISDARIIRNRSKIASAVGNARAVQRIQAEHGSFANFLWSFVADTPIDTPLDSYANAPASTPVSDAMSRALKKYGCKYVGTTICYAFMQATGMVNDHEAGCCCRVHAQSATKARRSAVRESKA